MNLRSQQQTGLSLTELLIAMAIGLILMAGITKVWLGSRQVERSNAALAAIQETGRFATAILERNIRLTGYPLYKQPNGNAVFDANWTKDDGNNDRIAVNYFASTPCSGEATTDAGASNKLHAFKVENGELRCGTEVLATGIDALQIQYGIDTDGDGIANRYVNATQVKAGVANPGTPDWPQVVSVWLALLVNSERDVLDATVAKTWVLLDKTISTDDRKMRRVFTTTIPIRNRMESEL